MNQAPCQRNKAHKAPVDRPLVGGFSFRRENMEKELWISIPMFYGYEASTLGRIRSYRSSHSDRPLKIMPTYPAFYTNQYGHLYVDITNKDGVKHKRSVHSLILETFDCRCPEGLECRHLNGIPSDNRIWNVVWGTRKENMQDKVKHGNSRKGCRPKLLECEVLEIRKKYKEGFSQSVLGEMYGVARTTVQNIIEGRTWGWLK